MERKTVEPFFLAVVLFYLQQILQIIFAFSKDEIETSFSFPP